jgi:hypothetical protein
MRYAPQDVVQLRVAGAGLSPEGVKLVVTFATPKNSATQPFSKGWRRELRGEIVGAIRGLRIWPACSDT